MHRRLRRRFSSPHSRGIDEEGVDGAIMPVLLIIALAASLGIHALVLFGPELDLPTFAEPLALQAELRAVPKSIPSLSAENRPAKRRLPSRLRTAQTALPESASLPRKRRPSRLSRSAAGAVSELAVPGRDEPRPRESVSTSNGDAEEGAVTLSRQVLPTMGRLPRRGTITYRVDRGDQGFQIGQARHAWEVGDEYYRITAMTETVGLVGLFKPLRFEAESHGRVDAAGLLPEHFTTRRKDRETGEQAEFDWSHEQLRMSDRPVRELLPGSQDLLSFPYQLALIADSAAGFDVPITTGKSYATYRLEVVGDEDIETPAGTFRCLHVRAPGEATTDLWLAYERSRLPIKIRHQDRKGGVLVQVAMTIELNQEP